jgi:sec-independent protein translocase protein TatB
MFDIGFWEMVLVGVVALLVFGPERLPRVARETALWVRKARSVVASVKQDINQELQLYELQESMKAQRQSLEDFTLQQRTEVPPVQRSPTQVSAGSTESHGETDDQTQR